MRRASASHGHGPPHRRGVSVFALLPLEKAGLVNASSRMRIFKLPFANPPKGLVSRPNDPLFCQLLEPGGMELGRRETLLARDTCAVYRVCGVRIRSGRVGHLDISIQMRCKLDFLALAESKKEKENKKKPAAHCPQSRRPGAAHDLERQAFLVRLRPPFAKAWWSGLRCNNMESWSSPHCLSRRHLTTTKENGVM